MRPGRGLADANETAASLSRGNQVEGSRDDLAKINLLIKYITASLTSPESILTGLEKLAEHTKAQQQAVQRCGLQGLMTYVPQRRSEVIIIAGSSFF